MPPKQHQSKSDRKQKAFKGTANVEASGFISFADVARPTHSHQEDSSSNLQTASHTPVYTGSDSDLGVICKKLAKRHTVTRLKALNELKEVLEDRGSEVIKDLLPYFVFTYHRLIHDNSRTLREELNNVLLIQLRIDRKAFAPHMKSLIGPWWMATCDTTPAVSTVAVAAHEFAFPAHKRATVMTNHCPAILRYLKENFNSKPETLSDMSTCTAEEADERFERVMVSSLLSLSKLMALLPNLPASTYEEVLGDSFWKKTSSKRCAVRGAALQVLTATCTHTPDIIRATNLQRLTNIVLNTLANERSELNIPHMLLAVVTFLKSFSECWSFIDIPKGIISKVSQLIRHYPSSALDSVLPIIAAMPNILEHSDNITGLLNLLMECGAADGDNAQLYATAAEICTYLLVRITDSSSPETNPLGECDLKGEAFNETLVHILSDCVVHLVQQSDGTDLIPLLRALHRCRELRNQNKSRVSWVNGINSTLQTAFIESLCSSSQHAASIKFINSATDLLSAVVQREYTEEWTPDKQSTETDKGVLEIIVALFNLCVSHITTLSMLNSLADDGESAIICWLYAVLKLGHVVAYIDHVDGGLLSIETSHVLNVLMGTTGIRCAFKELTLFDEKTNSHKFPSGFIRDFVVELLSFISTVSRKQFDENAIIGDVANSILCVAIKVKSLIAFVLSLECGLLTISSPVHDDVAKCVRYCVAYLQQEEQAFQDVCDTYDDMIARSSDATKVMFLVHCAKHPTISSHSCVGDLKLNSCGIIGIWAQLTSYYQQINSCSSNSNINCADVSENISNLICKAFLGRESNSCILSWQQCDLVLCWADVRGKFLPRVCDSTKARAAVCIADALSELIINTDLWEYQEEDRKHISTSQMQPNVWARHVCVLLSLTLTHEFGPATIESVSDAIGVFTSSQWQQWYASALRLVSDTSARVNNKYTRQLRYVIHCLFLLDDIWESSHCSRDELPVRGSVLHSIFPVALNTTFCIDVFRCLASYNAFVDSKRRSKNLVCQYESKPIQIDDSTQSSEVECLSADLTDAMACCAALLQSTVMAPLETRCMFFSEVTQELWEILSALSSCNNANEINILLSAADALLKHITFPDKATCVDYLTNKRRLVIDTPRYDDVLPRNTPVQYVTRVQEPDTGLVKIECENAVLVGIHKHGPDEEPFYTLLISPKGDSSDAREVQTEGHRVIIGCTDSPGSLGTDPLDILGGDTIDFVVNSPVEVNNEVSSDISSVAKLLKLLRTITRDLLASITDQSDTRPYNAYEVSFFETCILHVDAVVNSICVYSADKDSADVLKSLVAEYTGPVRALVLRMLDAHPVQNMSIVCGGLRLLKTLCTSPYIRGCGLWIVGTLKPKLHSILHSVRSTKLVLSDTERAQYSALLVRSLGAVIDIIQNRDLCMETIRGLEYASNFVSALGDDTSDKEVLQCALFACMRSVWIYRATVDTHFWSGNLIGNISVKEEAEPGVLAARAAEGRMSQVRAWEGPCVRLCLGRILAALADGLTWGMPSVEPVVAALESLDSALKNRSREECCQMLQDAGVGTDYSEENLWEVVGDPHIHAAVRVVIAKVLDVWCSRAMEPLVELSDSTKDDLSGTLPHACKAECDESDIATGRGVLTAILGEKLYVAFESYLQNYSDYSLNVVDRSASSQLRFRCPCGDENSMLIDTLDAVPDAENSRKGITSSLRHGVGREHVDAVGILLQWLLVLQKIDTHCTSSSQWAVRAVIGTYFTQSRVLTVLFRDMIRWQQYLQSTLGYFSGDLSGSFSALNLMQSFVGIDSDGLSTLASYALYRTVCFLPAAVRLYWNDSCNRMESIALERFVEEAVNDSLVRREIAIVMLAEKKGRLKAPLDKDEEDLAVRCSAVAREISTTYVADEVSIEMVIRMPKLYPLRNVEVECKKRMGISESRWRRWTLQIIQLLSQQDGSVLDAILLWKKNVDREFEGVEPCPICYSILHPKALTLPSLVCPTCNNKFHSSCLYKWFQTSGKSKCVLCQQSFF